MKSKTVVCVLVLLASLTLAIPAGSITTQPVLQPIAPDFDFPPWLGDTPNTPGGLCSLCALPQCGCGPAPDGYYTIYWCDCSGTNCRNACAYEPQW